MMTLLETCLHPVWRLSGQASALVVLVLAGQFLAGQRLSARWRYNLWLLLVVRLVLPFSWPSPLSVFNAVDWGTARASAVIERVVPAPPPAAAPAAIVATPAADPTRPPADNVETTPASSPDTLTAPPSPTPPLAIAPPKPHTPFPWRQTLTLLWAAGVLLLAARILFTSWQMQRRIRTATRLDDPDILALLEECRTRMGLRRPLVAWETGAIHSPAVFGFLRPQLLLPTGLARDFSAPELRHVFLHEMAHVRRLDLPMNWLVTLLQILHWFNPIVWLGLRRMQADRESACDALAIERNGDRPAGEYGRTIIKLLESPLHPATAPGLMGIVESKSQMVRRIRMIAHFQKNPRWSWLAAGLIALLAVVGLTDAAQRVRAEVAKVIAPEKTRRVTVLDAATGQPVAGARLYTPYASYLVVSKAEPPTLTDRSGVAYISTADLNYGFFVAHPDYASAAWQKSPFHNEAEFAGDCVIKLDRGEAIGGIVRDAAGQPLAGIGVEMKGVKGYWDEQKAVPFAQFPAYASPYFPPIVTDALGRWTCPHFPQGPSHLVFSFQRPGGGRHRVEIGNDYQPQVEDPALQTLRQSKLVTVFPEGVDVHGIVRDAARHPLAGITVTERDRRSQDPISVLQTDAQGRFTLPHRDPHQILLALTGEGFATTARVVPIAPGLPEQELTMSPAVPLRVRIVDEAGAPIAGASVSPTELNLGWTGQSDAQGRVNWPAAILEAEAYSIAEEKHPARFLRLAPSTAETTVVLRSSGPEGTQVTIKALGEDGKPLSHFTVLAAYGDGSSSQDRGFEPLAEGQDGACSVIVPFDKSRNNYYRLRVESPGLIPFVSEAFDPLAGEPPALTATLRTGHPVQGKVLLPNGQPAAQASVILTNPTGARAYINVVTFLKAKMRVEPRDAKTLHADAEGAFALPEISPDAAVVFIHEQGFLTTTAAQLQGMSEVRLGAWGTVEGTLSVNGQPRAGQRLQMQSLFGGRPYDLSFNIDVKTDQDGHFRIAPAPVGQCVLYATQSSDGQWPQSYMTLVDVKGGGEVTRVDVTGHGAAVTGRVHLSAPEVELDWQKDINTALLSQEGNDLKDQPTYGDFIRERDYRAAIAQYSRPGNFVRSTYPLVFEPDGTFRGEGVPPGKYKLRVTAAKHDHERNHSANELGSLEKTVVIPLETTTAPVSLGDFTMVVAEGAAPRRPPIQFTAQTFQGRPLPLTNYAGKQVLLLFWASWAPPSAETLAQWKLLYEAHGTDPRFVMLGISLDDDVAAAQKFVEAQQWHWDQGWLTGAEKARITEKLAVDILPSAFLLGPDGRLLTRNPADAQLRKVVESFLSSTK